jgi:two-component system, OmpR family, sensor histidine kinase TctE
MKPTRSLRWQLLVGILLPVAALLIVNAIGLYQQALRAADTAYDRTLLASAKSIGELLDVSGEPDAPRLTANLVYAALEPFEADNRSRMYYKVSGFAGEMISGFEDLPQPSSAPRQPNPYAALVDFYDDSYRAQPIRMAVLQQPVAGQAGIGIAVIQVAETLELRHTLAREMLFDTLWRQIVLLMVISWVVIVVVQHATAPIRNLSTELKMRAEDALSPIETRHAPRELIPLLEATNGLMDRLDRLLQHQQRFVRDAAHQIRTPLAVLKTQVQSALRDDLPPRESLTNINLTVDRATQLANQMLSLAKVAQLRELGALQPVEWSAVVRAVSLELSPLIADKELDFDIQTTTATVVAHEWMLRELTRNLLHNAIRHSPTGGRLHIRMASDGWHAALTLEDDGPGISDALRQRLFQPFSSGDGHHGSGLGLAICREIVLSLKGQLRLTNRTTHQTTTGLDAVVTLPTVHTTPVKTP